MARVKKRWEDEQLLQIGRCTPHTDFKREWKYENSISLNGNCQFLFIKAPEYSPENFSAVDFKDDGWDRIEVLLLGDEGIRQYALYGRLVSVSCKSSLCALRESDGDLQKMGDGFRGMGRQA